MGEYIRPEMPEYLIGLARTEWERIVPLLENMGILAECDQTMLALYCTAFAEWREADDLCESPVITTVNGNIIQNPALSIRTNAWERLKKVCAEFGMSPAARTGLAILPKVKKEDNKSRFFTKNKA
jgi:P27 family predicted phage terminase small subunit